MNITSSECKFTSDKSNSQSGLSTTMVEQFGDGTGMLKFGVVTKCPKLVVKVAAITLSTCITEYTWTISDWSLNVSLF